LRRGAAFVVLRADGKLLVRTRPAKGLLGAMTEVPTGDWTHDFDARRSFDAAPVCKRKIAWRRTPGVVSHVFTHFPLELAVFAGTAAAATPAPKGARWVALGDLAGEALPSLMRKVIAHALARGKRKQSVADVFQT
jgi:A/G-specific adenine glycosylase